MDINPFDQFAADFNAAAPQQQQQQGQPPSDPNAPPPFNVVSQQQQQPVMNNGGMYQQPMGGMMSPPPSHPQPAMNQGMMGPPQGLFQSSTTPAGFASSMSAPPPFGDASVASAAIVPSNVPSNPYSLGPPSSGSVVPMMGGPPQQMYAQPAQLQQPHSQTVMASPFGAAPLQQQPPSMNPYGQQQPQQQPPPMQPAMDPFAPPQQTMIPPSSDPWSSGGSVVPMQQPPPAMSPAPQQIASDPWGAAAPVPSESSSALVPSNTANDDPFGIFGAAAPAPPQPQEPPLPLQVDPSLTGPPPPHLQQPSDNDPWAEMGFGSPVPAPTSTPLDQDLISGGGGTEEQLPVEPSSPSKRTKGELPPGGEWYDAKIFTPTLGVMFFKPKELTDSLFLSTDKNTVDMLEDRPVVAFIVEGSSARSAGVELGHVLLKVNGIDVKNPKEASRLIKEGPRPLPLLFYVPNTPVVVAEGEHMVKYNTKETGAPNSAKDWKPKYVVIGGIIAQPWMMNMYRSKSEYDIAVIETQARRPISVKVKQFSLQGSRIQNDWQGPQMVKYKNKLHPWKYIVVLPASKNPIKIASPNLSQLKPVHEGIRRVLEAQQSRNGGNHHSAQPVRRSGGGYNGRGGY